MWQRLACLLIIPLALACAGSAAALSVGQGGNDDVFDTGETPEFSITSGNRDLTWQVLDLDRAPLGSGTLPGFSTGMLALPVHDPGYYRLIVEEAPDEAGRRGAHLERSFVVLPDRALGGGARFGVVSHFAGGWQPRILRLAARAGIGGIRDEEPWKTLELSPGRFEIPPALEHYVRDARSLGLQVVIALTFGNPLYDDGQTPSSDAGIAAFARYGRVVAEHFSGSVQALEVWNEFNGDFASGPALNDRPLAYARLLRETYRSIKSVRPRLTVVGGAVAGVPLPYFRQLFDHGVMPSLDVLEIHPYRAIPEGVEYDIRALRSLADSYGGGIDKPIWATEAGVSLSQDRENVAGLLVRLLTLLTSEGVERVYWYLLRDQGVFTGLGLLTWDAGSGAVAPTPAYAAYATLIRMIGAARHIRREASDPRTYVELFQTDDHDVRVAWAPTTPTVLSVRGRTDIRIVRLDGREIGRIPAGTVARVALTERPIYLVGSVDAFSEVRTDRLVADSVTDFSPTQGERHWSYGFYEPIDGPDSRRMPSAQLSFRRAQPAEDDWSFHWSDPRMPFFGIAREKMHPSKLGSAAVPAVRRWESPDDETIRIAGTVRRESGQGDGIQLDIAVGGNVVQSLVIGGAGRSPDGSFAFTHRIDRGTPVDFVVWPGSSDQATTDFDMTELRVQIARLDLPR